MEWIITHSLQEEDKGPFIKIQVNISNPNKGGIGISFSGRHNMKNPSINRDRWLDKLEKLKPDIVRAINSIGEGFLRTDGKYHSTRKKDLDFSEG